MEMEPASNNPAIVALEEALSCLNTSALNSEKTWRTLQKEAETNRLKFQKLQEEMKELQACILELKASRLGLVMFPVIPPGNE